MIIKVNGYTINAAVVGMLDRTCRRETLDGGKCREETGVYVCFAAGGRKWIADPEAKEVERKFAAYDGVQELPY